MVYRQKKRLGERQASDGESRKHLDLSAARDMFRPLHFCSWMVSALPPDRRPGRPRKPFHAAFTFRFMGSRERFRSSRGWHKKKFKRSGCSWERVPAITAEAFTLRTISVPKWTRKKCGANSAEELSHFMLHDICKGRTEVEKWGQ